MTVKPLLLLATIFLVEDCAHGVYVHLAEFNPAREEFETAHAKSNLPAMLAAWSKERAALQRETDPIWFIRTNPTQD